MEDDIESISRYRNRMEFKEGFYGWWMHDRRVDIETEWNLKI